MYVNTHGGQQKSAFSFENALFSMQSVFIKMAFIQPANRAGPIVGQVLEGCANVDTVLGVSFFGVIEIAARAFVYVHYKNLTFLRNFLVLQVYYTKFGESLNKGDVEKVWWRKSRKLGDNCRNTLSINGKGEER